MWSWLEDTADNKEELDHQAFRTTLERSVADVRGLLQRTSCWRKELDAQDADTKVIRVCDMFCFAQLPPVVALVDEVSSCQPTSHRLDLFCAVTPGFPHGIAVPPQGDDLIKEAARHATRVGVKIRYVLGLSWDCVHPIDRDLCLQQLIFPAVTLPVVSLFVHGVCSSIYRDLADMASEDRTKVSKGAVDGVIREAVRFQKNYEAKCINDGESDNIGGNM